MDPNLVWFILFNPMIAAAVIHLVTRKSSGLSTFISVASSVFGLIAAFGIFFTRGGHGPQFVEIPWIDFGASLRVPIGLMIDDLSKLMLLVVTGIGAAVHIYSTVYMEDDESKSRYFGNLSLFMFSMLGIVLANNFVMMFIFWELVGVSSYLLIGHWFTKNTAADAANKAFLTNRIGDFGFMLGILMIWAWTGSVVFTEIGTNLSGMNINPGYLTAAVLLVFCGAVGKSAQVPLHVWLPDAMEGPTPVSALIHAATMVAAGVYMLARVFFLIELTPDAQFVIMLIGAVTALLAALMATQQDDIKRILAYSTLSQLGYMIMAIGLAAPGAAMFHLFTHAFFKALLFLGAGAIIYALHHEQDIWKMGGLSKSMWVTFLTFAAGYLALVGCPGLAGFFSKDLI
ncbi:MAG TPA: NADH-quinone oxidoreductase subunit L, partial [Chthoniobacteraceae bacterium]|nr:NADH-quinone oxidoreductase subunit L [Chthoniobacteraceae bacterium]